MQTSTLKNSPLHIALITGQANTIKTVLDLGGDPLIKNSSGENAFDLAEKLDLSPYIVKLLKRSLIQ
jgi:ankyrin repeat protein